MKDDEGGSDEPRSLNVRTLPHPAARGATWLDMRRGRLREWLGGMMVRLGLPGAIAETTLHDPVTGLDIAVRVSALYTRLTIDGRDFYFDRLSGRYDGAGMGCE